MDVCWSGKSGGQGITQQARDLGEPSLDSAFLVDPAGSARLVLPLPLTFSSFVCQGLFIFAYTVSIKALLVAATHFPVFSFLAWGESKSRPLYLSAYQNISLSLLTDFLCISLPSKTTSLAQDSLRDESINRRISQGRTQRFYSPLLRLRSFSRCAPASAGRSFLRAGARKILRARRIVARHIESVATLFQKYFCSVFF